MDRRAGGLVITATVLLELHVDGDPVSQGNHRIAPHGHLYDAAGDALDVWRAVIAIEARKMQRRAGLPTLDEPVGIDATFRIRRPRSPRFPDHPATHPDLDKLQRACGDALVQAGLLRDDGRIVDWHARKRWADVRPGLDLYVVAVGT